MSGIRRARLLEEVDRLVDSDVEDADVGRLLGDSGDESVGVGTEEDMEVEVEDDLFALQVFVERVESEPMPSLKVAFRLMDFPTLVIEPSSSEEFKSGKSCLFRISLRDAIAQLRSSPLYLMLIKEESQGRGVLVASTTLDLSGLCGLDGGDDSNIILPRPSSTWGWRPGRFPVFDLMGNRVAYIIARVRLCSFGDGLIPHLGVRVDDVDSKENVEVDVDQVAPRLESQVPVPVELLQTMQTLSEKVENIERMQRSLFETSNREEKAFQVLKAPGKPVVMGGHPRKKGWLPHPGQEEAHCLPPAMYYKHRIDTEEQKPVKVEKGTLMMGPLLDELTVKDADLADRMVCAMNRQRISIDRPSSRLASAAGGTPQTEVRRSNRSLRGSRLSDRMSHEGAFEAKKDTTKPLRYLLVRKTRTQKLREQANKRKYLNSTSSPNMKDSTGFVQIAADLARSRMLKEKDIEQRKYTQQKRAERTTRDGGKMQMENLIDSVMDEGDSSLILSTLSPLSVSSAVHAERTSRPSIDKQRTIRSKQLDLMWQGRMNSGLAYNAKVEASKQKPEPSSRQKKTAKAKSSSMVSSGLNSKSKTFRYGRHAGTSTTDDLGSFVMTPVPGDHDVHGFDGAQSMTNSRYHDFDVSQRVGEGKPGNDTINSTKTALVNTSPNSGESAHFNMST
mmetsp:Transcript_11119/g.20641  ORF Transcript_11119/g.20641 Transcript_11119/m.20641 type:complete len:675 (+) Transcript_11119:170-2194(+)